MKKRLLSFSLLFLALFSLQVSVRSEDGFVAVEDNTNNYQNEKCDIVVENGLCLYDGQKLLLADAKPDGLVGYWSFDDYKGMDSSGNHLHAIGGVKSGPGYGGSGYSAVIGNGNFVAMPASTLFDSKVLSITFWLFLSEDSSEDTKWCPLIYKGGEKPQEKIKARAPAVFLDKKTRNLKIYFTTTANGTSTDGEFLDSNARIPFQRWTHIAIVRNDKKIRLYINGILDSVIVTDGSNVPNDSPLFIGNSPDYIDTCDIPGYVDEFRYYTRVLEDYEIEAEASPALGNVQPSFVLLGCIDCPSKQANVSCIEGYHLCTTIELHSAGYQVAKAMGWINWDTKIWSYQAVKRADEGLGTGLCCIN